jgi:hypothetical protein
MPWATHVVRYEHLNDDLNKVLALINKGPIRVPRFNVSKCRNGARYQEVIDAPTRAFIEREFGEEMEELGYRWEE